jgi:hypothetical protein
MKQPSQKGKIEWITPERAAALLARAENVRRIKAWWVADLASYITRGTFQLTPDGLVLDVQGILRNGQHRLQAIVAAGIGTWMWVFRDCTEDEVRALDRGVGRVISEVLGESRPIMDPLGLLIRLVTDHRRPDAAMYQEALRGPAGTLLRALVQDVRAAPFYSCSAMKVGAITVIKRDPSAAEYVNELYRDLQHFRVERMPPVALALVRQQNKGVAVGSTAQTDTLARALAVYDPAKRDLERITVKNTTLARSHVRTVWASTLRHLGVVDPAESAD